MNEVQKQLITTGVLTILMAPEENPTADEGNVFLTVSPKQLAILSVGLMLADTFPLLIPVHDDILKLMKKVADCIEVQYPEDVADADDYFSA